MATLTEVFKNIVFRNEQHKAFTSVVRVASVAEKHISRVLEPFNFHPQQYRILRALRKAHPAGIRVSDLKAFLVDTKSDVPRLIDRLEKAGLVKRRSDKKDKRTTLVVITEKGLDKAMEIGKHEDQFYVPVDRLSVEQARQLNELLEAMYKVLTE